MHYVITNRKKRLTANKLQTIINKKTKKCVYIIYIYRVYHKGNVYQCRYQVKKIILNHIRSTEVFIKSILLREQHCYVSHRLYHS